MKTKFIMKEETLLGQPDNFTSSEFTILKSMALGLNCEEIRKLLDLEQESYASVCQGLFEKLGASNHYTAVKSAYQKQYLIRKDLCKEDLKSFALEFAYNNLDQLINKNDDSKQLLWKLYDILLEFHSQMENKHS